MRHVMTAAVFAAALAALPAAGLAAQSSSKPAAKPAATAGKAASHSTTGTVKSIDAATLVIVRTGKNGGEMRFTLDPSTQREGTIAAGSNVSVRYHADGQNNVATAVMGPKAHAAKK